MRDIAKFFKKVRRLPLKVTLKAGLAVIGLVSLSAVFYGWLAWLVLSKFVFR